MKRTQKLHVVTKLILIFSVVLFCWNFAKSIQMQWHAKRPSYYTYGTEQFDVNIGVINFWKQFGFGPPCYHAVLIGIYVWSFALQGW